MILVTPIIASGNYALIPKSAAFICRKLLARASVSLAVLAVYLALIQCLAVHSTFAIPPRRLRVLVPVAPLMTPGDVHLIQTTSSLAVQLYAVSLVYRRKNRAAQTAWKDMRLVRIGVVVGLTQPRILYACFALAKVDVLSLLIRKHRI